MAKLTLDNIGNFTSGTVTTINTNFDRIEAALEKTLSRDGTVPNQMAADLDLNDQDLINVKDIHADTGIFDNIVASNIDFEDIVPQMTALRDQTIAAAAEGAESAEIAHDWAVEEENVLVNDGIHTPDFSAYHWAQVAGNAAAAVASGVSPFGPFTGDGVQTAFTLPIAPIISGNCVVFVDGVWQDYQARSVSGTTLTFTEAPPVGTTISGVIFTVVENVLAPAAGSVTSASLDAGDNAAMRTVLDVYSKAEVDTKDKGVKGADLASSGTVDLGAATGDFVDITGTTTIASFGTAAAGVERTVRFTGILTLTHNAVSMILHNGMNITTYNGLIMRFRSLGAGNWVEVSQTPARGTFTPGLTFGGAAVGMTFHGSNAGVYIKEGKKVTAWIYLRLTAKGSSVGAALITGLPIGATGNNGSGIAMSLVSGMSGLTGMIFGGPGGAGATTIGVRQWAATGNAALNDTHFTDTSWWIFSTTYEVA